MKLIFEPIGCGGEEWLTAEDREYIEGLRSQRRKQEVTSWRAALRRELGCEAEIRYNEVGAPYMVDYEGYISVSHSRESVAVMISERRCAVDIESCSRDFERVASRYVRAEERKLQCDLPLLPLIWSAKETLYKYSGRTELDMIKDLKIKEINATTLIGAIGEERVEMRYFMRDGQIVVHTK